MTVTECVRKIYQTSGLIGFYKGITASYFGISETVIHFVIYEAIKAKIVSNYISFEVHFFRRKDLDLCSFSDRLIYDKHIPLMERLQEIS